MKKLIAALAIAGLALAGCSKSDDAGDKTSADLPEVTVGLTYIPDVQFAPFYAAEDAGYFAEEGVKVNIRHHGSQESLFGALQSGDEDVVFAGGDEMMVARSTGIDVVNWATMYQDYPVQLIVLEDSAIQTAADIRGKKIGLPGPYGENYYALLAMLKENDLTDKDVSIEYIGYTQAAALKAGDVDAIIGFVNSDFVAMRHSGMKVRTVMPSDKVLPLIGVGLGSLQDKMDVETYAKILRAVEKGVDRASSDPDFALEATKKRVPSMEDKAVWDSAQATLTETLKYYSLGDTFGQQDEPTWSDMSDFLLSMGILEKPVPYKEAFTSNVVNKSK